MALQPSDPAVWEQALVDGRMVHPSDSEASVAYAFKRFEELGGSFTGEGEPEPEPTRGPLFEEAVAPVEEEASEEPLAPPAPLVPPAPLAPPIEKAVMPMSQAGLSKPSTPKAPAKAKVNRVAQGAA